VKRLYLLLLCCIVLASQSYCGGAYGATALRKIKNWGLWTHGGEKDYELGVDDDTRVHDKPSACIRAIVENPKGFASIEQEFSAEEFRGKHIRYSGAIKTNNVTDLCELWMKVSGPDGVVSFDNMEDRALKGTSEWKDCSIVLNVPKESRSIKMGFLVSGTGTGWLNSVAVEAVSDQVPVTGKPVAPGTFASEGLKLQPSNLDFEKR